MNVGSHDANVIHLLQYTKKQVKKTKKGGHPTLGGFPPFCDESIFAALYSATLPADQHIRDGTFDISPIKD